MNRTTRRIVAIGLPVAVISATGIAFAAWTSTGSGTGTAASTHESNSTSISAVSNPGDLYPGDVSTMVVRVTNGESYPVSLTYLPSVSSAAVGSPACAAGAVSTTALGSDGSTTALAADDEATVIGVGGHKDFTVGVTMIANPSDNCKDKTFTFTWDATTAKAQLVSAAS